MESVYSTTWKHLQISADHDDTIPVYSTLIREAQGKHLNTQKKKRIHQKDPHCIHAGNPNVSPNQEPQDLSQSVEFILVYARPNPSKEELPPQAK